MVKKNRKKNLPLLTPEDRAIRSLRNRPKTIAVDIDGCLAEFDEWKGFEHLGKPRPGVVKEVCKEFRAGAHVIIHTCRATSLNNLPNLESLRVLEDWLFKHKILYHDIWVGIGKPSADEYWDDKAVNVLTDPRFSNR